MENNPWASLKKCLILAFKRNSLIMLLALLVLSAFIYFSIYVIIIIKLFNPALLKSFVNFIYTNYPSDHPKPCTQEFFLYIFTNNTGFYWNPQKLLVWIPIFGTLVIGLTFLINGVIIGSVAAITGLEYGPLLPIAGLIPHGIIEIPAFIFQWTAIIRWHITISMLLFNKIRGEKVEKTKIKSELIDVFILSAISIFLLFIAALIETYITPLLIELVDKNGGSYLGGSNSFL